MYLVQRGTGVLARGDLNYLILVARVGEAGLTSNKFKDCRQGIDIGDYMNSEIHGNRLVNTGIGEHPASCGKESMWTIVVWG